MTETELELKNEKIELEENVFEKENEKQGKITQKEVASLIKLCVICVPLVIFLMIVFMLVKDRGNNAPTPETLNLVLAQEFVDKSELVTQSIDYKGKLTRDNGGRIPFLTKKSITLSYEAEIKAGIDPSRIKVTSVTEEIVTVKVPKSEVLSQAVDLNSVEIVDEEFALFSTDKKSEIIKAAYAEAQNNLDKLVKGTAEEEKTEKLKIEELLEKADKGVESTLRAMFKGAIGDRELKVVFE